MLQDLSVSLRLTHTNVQEAQGKLKEVENVMTEKEEQFEKELAVAQKLAGLHKTHGDKRTAEAVQLESIVRDLRRHVEVLKAPHEPLESSVRCNDCMM